MAAVGEPQQHRIAAKEVGVLPVGATREEQGRFETIASAFDSCKGAAQGSSCDHEHAG